MSIDDVLDTDSRSEPMAAVKAFLDHCQASGLRPDDLIERWLSDERIERFRGNPAASALLTAYVQHRLLRGGVWRREGSRFIAETSQLRKIKRAAERYRAVVGEDYAYHLTQGILAFERRDLGVARRHFERSARDVPDDAPDSKLIRSGATYRNPWEMTSQLLAEPSADGPPAVAQFGTFEPGRPSLLFASDRLYFDRFPPIVIETLGAAGFEGNIVFAAVRGTEFDEAAIARCVKQAASNGLPVTMLDYPFEGTDVPSFATVVRFRAARDLLDLGARYVLVADLDSRFTREAVELILADHADTSLELSLAFNRYGLTSLPWGCFSAATVAFRDSETSRLYLRCLNNYVANVFNASGRNWGLDQTALWAAYELVRWARPTAAIGNLFAVKNAISLIGSDPEAIAFKMQARGF